MRSTTIYYLFSCLAAAAIGFTAAVYVPFLLSIGLSLGQVALVNVVFWTVIVLAEVPTGMIADGKSRTWSLKLGAAFCGVGLASYAFAHSFSGAAFAEATEGIGQAFLSGASQAWIADALKRDGREAETRHVYATESLLDSLSTVLAGIVGGLAGLASPRLAFLFSGLACVLAVLVAHRLMNGQGEPFHRVSQREALRQSVALLRRSSELQWIVAAGTLVGLVVVFNHYWAPFFQPNVGTLGLTGVWVGMYLVLTLAGAAVRRASVAPRIEMAVIASALGFGGVGLAVMSRASGISLAVVGLVIHEIGRGVFQPTSTAFVQHRLESHYRATFGSLQSFIGRLGFAGTPLVVWFAIRGQPDTPATIAGVWLVVGTLLAAGALLLWLLRPRPA